MKKKHFYGKRKKYNYSIYYKIDKVEVAYGAKTLKELFQLMEHVKKVQAEANNEKTN